MTRNGLCWLVSGLQVALAVFLWWYAPLQIVTAQKAVDANYPKQHAQLGLDFYRRNTPAPAERVSLALDFPAAILAGPFNIAFPRRLYETKLRLLSMRDLAFFFWTGVLWYWTMSILIQRGKSGDVKKLSRSVRIALLVCGLGFALIVGAIGLDALVSKFSAIPDKQIAPFGLLWSLGLAAYFLWKLRSE